ncbi:unnamed protein product [Pleuronectes platessa]|uniref:Uncharacterized protein n=1 Tax=Pleuronectes platessa TaxID=8262 RepID=A0A9N7Z0L1_PLEPL|nr:unnamed protein product [Pleuronectes platessa]
MSLSPGTGQGESITWMCQGECITWTGQDSISVRPPPPRLCVSHPLQSVSLLPSSSKVSPTRPLTERLRDVELLSPCDVSSTRPLAERLRDVELLSPCDVSSTRPLAERLRDLELLSPCGVSSTRPLTERLRDVELLSPCDVSPRRLRETSRPSNWLPYISEHTLVCGE